MRGILHDDIPSVAIYPSAEGRGETKWCISSNDENTWSRHQRLFEENVRKTKNTKVCEF